MMKFETFKKLEIDLYHEKLDNGLEVYIVPKNNINNVYVTFSTRFGSRHIEFIPANEKKLKKYQPGIAHFLEHQLFEQLDGVDPFAFYSQRGADSNANTSNQKTTYLFSSPNKLDENLNFLLDFVQSPHFTDESVAKEKGIIEQEINMYEDDPFYVLYDKSLYNSIVKNPVRIPVIGTIDSINKITKEDLYECYNTFYDPSNMFVVITGNVDPKQTIDIIKKNQQTRSVGSLNQPIKVKKYNEPDTVSKESETIKMNVAIPKVSCTYKIKLPDINETAKREFSDYLVLYLDSKFGSSSLFYEQLKEQGIITNSLMYTSVDIDTHLVCMLIADAEDPDLLIRLIDDEIKKFNVTEEEFNRKKKTVVSALFYLSDNIYRINNKIMNNIIKTGKVITNDYDEVSNYSFEKFRSVVKKIDFSNRSTVKVLPKKLDLNDKI